MFLKILLNSQEHTCAEVFSCIFCKIFKNTYLHRTPLVAASGILQAPTAETIINVIRVMVVSLYNTFLDLLNSEEKWANGYKGFIENYKFPCVSDTEFPLVGGGMDWWPFPLHELFEFPIKTVAHSGVPAPLKNESPYIENWSPLPKMISRKKI